MSYKDDIIPIRLKANAEAPQAAPANEDKPDLLTLREAVMEHIIRWGVAVKINAEASEQLIAAEAALDEFSKTHDGSDVTDRCAYRGLEVEAQSSAHLVAVATLRETEMLDELRRATLAYIDAVKSS